MSGYFFKTETIDWQSRTFSYIVKDTVIFSEDTVYADKTQAPVRSAGEDLFL